MYNLQHVLGVPKASIKRRIDNHYTDRRHEPEVAEVLTLLGRRGNAYTLGELEKIAMFMTSGVDDCVMDNTHDFSAIEVWTAAQNYKKSEAAWRRLKELKLSSG